jgi:hypothetical protein
MRSNHVSVAITIFIFINGDNIRTSRLCVRYAAHDSAIMRQTMLTFNQLLISVHATFIP